jgi:hypothetical protein
VSITFTTVCFYLQKVNIDIISKPQGMQFRSYVGLLQIGVGETGASCYRSYTNQQPVVMVPPVITLKPYRATACSRSIVSLRLVFLRRWKKNFFSFVFGNSSIPLYLFYNSEFVYFYRMGFVTAAQLKFRYFIYFQICITCLCSCDSLRNWMA